MPPLPQLLWVESLYYFRLSPFAVPPPRPMSRCMDPAMVVSVPSLAPAPSSTISRHTCCPTLHSPTCAHTEGPKNACQRSVQSLPRCAAPACFLSSMPVAGPLPLFAPEGCGFPALVLLSPRNTTDFQSSYPQDLPTSPDWALFTRPSPCPQCPLYCVQAPSTPMTCSSLCCPFLVP